MHSKWASATAIGTSHLRSGQPKQDSLKVTAFDDDSFFACVSDGAGSASQSKLGSWLACRFLSDKFKRWNNISDDTPPEQIIWEWIEDYRDLIATFASKKGIERREFACTLACVFVTKNKYIALHVGDSCIVSDENNEWQTIFWPENGEYASTTYFLTDDPSPKLNVRRSPLTSKNFAIFSDGINSVALSYQTQTAFPGFFDAMFSQIHQSKEDGYMRETSSALLVFLNSERLCEKTDDDKSLVLISRNHES